MGVSGVVVISESHLSVHTWPEVGYVALDIYTCGDKARPEAAVQHALKAFGAANMHITEVTRGLDEEDKVFFHSMITWEETIPDNILNHRPRRRRRVHRRKRSLRRSRHLARGEDRDQKLMEELAGEI